MSAGLRDSNACDCDRRKNEATLNMSTTQLDSGAAIRECLTGDRPLREPPSSQKSPSLVC